MISCARLIGHYSGPNLRWLPLRAALATQDFQLHQGHDELPDRDRDLLEGRRLNIDPVFRNECVPLGRFRRVCVELFCKSDWRFIDRKSGFPALKGVSNRTNKWLALELEEFRQCLQIVEVLYAGICYSEPDHGFKLLGDNCLPRVGKQPRCRAIQQCWKVRFDGIWRDGITKPNIDLHG